MGHLSLVELDKAHSLGCMAVHYCSLLCIFHLVALSLQVHAWRPKEVVGLAQAMAAAGVKHDALMAAVAAAAMQFTVTRREVQEVLEACQKLGCPSEELARHLDERAKHAQEWRQAKERMQNEV